MFGKPQRGVSERPNKSLQPLIPKWISLLVGILLLIAAITGLLIWKPWQPVGAVELNATPNISTARDNAQEFRFYDLLPKQQVSPIPKEAVPDQTANDTTDLVIAEPEPAASAVNSANPTIASSEANASYILQVRSYSDPDSADARRAEVIMNGLSADVIQTVENGKTWYRVISGPYESQAAALAAQQSLQNSGIDSIVVKRSLATQP